MDPVDPLTLLHAETVDPRQGERRSADRRTPATSSPDAAQRERELHLATLRGAVRALCEVLAVVDPVAYCQALRVQRLAMDLAASLALTPAPALDVAALLAPLGHISLPAELQARLHAHEPLDHEDQRILACLPQLTDRLLAPAPGLEEVRALILLRHHQGLPEALHEHVPAALKTRLARLAAVLRVAADFDDFKIRGFATGEALGLLRNQAAAGEQDLVACLAAQHADANRRVEMRSLPLSRLRPGMVIAEALCTSAGQLLVARGFEITESFLERLHNYRRGLVREPVQVMLPAADVATDSRHDGAA
jgi:hypothetical protein